MTKCPDFQYLLVLPHLRIQNANAISSPLTHGFPAISAFTGLMWALQRKASEQNIDLQFKAVAVISHKYEEQATQGGFIKTFQLTRNPVGKDGKPAAIVEEGRIHLEISLVFAVSSHELKDDSQRQQVAEKAKTIVSTMRIAGGTVIPQQTLTARHVPYIVAFTGDEQGQHELFSSLKMRLLPGFALVERQDLLDKRYDELVAQNDKASRLDAWLSLSRFNWKWQQVEKDKGEWQHDRKGWLVPIPIGYGALTNVMPPGSVKNARDSATPFCFAESLYGIGEWLSPHRLQTPKQMLWYPQYDTDLGIYRYRNDFVESSVPELEYDYD